MRYFWLDHPQRPGEDVLVFRGFWGRLLKPKGRATVKEAEQYELYALALMEANAADTVMDWGYDL